jgi:hypothetical protein
MSLGIAQTQTSAEIGMDLVYYASVPGCSEEQLKRALQALIPDHHIEVFRSMDAFVLRLRQPGITSRVAILFAPTRNEMSRLAMLEGLLDSTTLILILPDRDVDTIRMGHRLRPRFLSFVDRDFYEVPAVLEKMLRTAGGQKT